MILTESKNYQKYLNIISENGQSIESSLHLHLLEHLNAEILIGTIFNIESAIEWLQSTFFWIRVHKNPSYYQIKDEKSIKTLIQTMISLLSDVDLIKIQKDSNQIISTPLGIISARLYIKYETIKRFFEIKKNPSHYDILVTVSSAHEFTEIKFNIGDRPILNALLGSSNIKYKLGKDKRVKELWHKIFLYIQLLLSNVHESDGGCKLPFRFHQDSSWILNHAKRILKGLYGYLEYKRDVVGMINCLEL